MKGWQQLFLFVPLMSLFFFCSNFRIFATPLFIPVQRTALLLFFSLNFKVSLWQRFERIWNYVVCWVEHLSLSLCLSPALLSPPLFPSLLFPFLGG